MIGNEIYIHNKGMDVKITKDEVFVNGKSVFKKPEKNKITTKSINDDLMNSDRNNEDIYYKRNGFK